MERALRSTLVHALGYLLVLEAMLIAAVLFWPDFQKGIPYFKTLSSLPIAKDLLKPVEQSGVEGYIVVQHFFKGCNVMGTSAAVLFAMGAIAGEAHRGTLETWLSRPLSRGRIMLERWFGGAVALTLPILLSSVTVPEALALIDETMPRGGLILGAVHESLFVLCFYSFTFLLSCLSSRPITIAFGMLLFTTFNFAMYLITTVTHWSVFRLADINVFGAILDTRQLDLTTNIGFVAFNVLCIALSLFVFARRVP
jgi:ABC-type transport system involved in multi-copper enzyme maturation permease subunit